PGPVMPPRPMPAAEERQLQRPRDNFSVRSARGRVASIRVRAGPSEQDAHDGGDHGQAEGRASRNAPPAVASRAVARRAIALDAWLAAGPRPALAFRPRLGSGDRVGTFPRQVARHRVNHAVDLDTDHRDQSEEEKEGHKNEKESESR